MIPTIPAERLQAASQLVEWLRQTVNEAVREKPLPPSNRAKASSACFGIAQEHHSAIVLLDHHCIYASSFALLRSEFEAYIRGLWLFLCASDAKVDKFLAGKEPPPIKELLDAVEQTPSFSAQVLSHIKKNSWDAMCAYAHTGGLHVQRWITSEGVEPNYELDEVEQVLHFAELIAALSVIAIAQLTNNDVLAQRVLEKVQMQ